MKQEKHPTDFINEVGTRIKNAREAAGITQTFMATALGLTQSNYGRLEKDDKRLDVVRIEKISLLLSKSVYDLLYDMPKEPPVLNINWKPVGSVKPTNVNKLYPGNPETTYVSCLVWVCNPEKIIGGIFDVIRWDVDNDTWHEPDMQKWYYNKDLPCSVITHFSDDINTPTYAVDQRH